METVTTILYNIIFSAVKLWIAIIHIQKKYKIYVVYCVYLLCIYKYKTCMYIFKKICYVYI